IVGRGGGRGGAGRGGLFARDRRARPFAQAGLFVGRQFGLGQQPRVGRREQQRFFEFWRRQVGQARLGQLVADHGQGRRVSAPKVVSTFGPDVGAAQTHLFGFSALDERQRRIF